VEKVLITGANGYIGSNLVKLLEKQGDFELHLASRAKIEGQHSSYAFDITNHSRLEAVVGEIRPSLVIHLAAIGINRAKNDAPESLLDVNFRSTFSLARMCKGLPDFRKFIYLTTYMECSGSEKPITPDSPLCPQSHYGLSKSLSTSALNYMSRSGELNANVLRVFSAYGMDELKGGYLFVPLIFDALINNKVIETTSLRQKRDFVYIKDVVDAILHSMKKERTEGAIFNVGSGKPVALAEVASKIMKLYPDSKGRIDIGKKPERPGEAPEYFADISKTRDEFGWQPKYTLDEGLKETFDFYNSQ